MEHNVPQLLLSNHSFIRNSIHHFHVYMCRCAIGCSIDQWSKFFLASLVFALLFRGKSFSLPSFKIGLFSQTGLLQKRSMWPKMTRHERFGFYPRSQELKVHQEDQTLCGLPTYLAPKDENQVCVVRADWIWERIKKILIWRKYFFLF